MTTDTPARTKTTYHVLQEITVDGNVANYAPVAANIEANSTAHALRVWADAADQAHDGTYIAIPARSFKPTKVTFATQKTVTLG